MSPTGFPFKVALLAGTGSDPAVYLARPRIPTLYYLLAVLLIALLGYARYNLKTAPLGLANWKLSHWHFFNGFLVEFSE